MSLPAQARNSQCGQTTVFLVTLIVALVMLGGLAYDGAQILNARREASNLALEAARAGAQAISTAAIYRDSGPVLLHPQAAQNAASKYLSHHHDWSISVRGDTVSTTVWLTEPLRILSAIGIESRRVVGTATAQAVRGVLTGEDV